MNDTLGRKKSELKGDYDRRRKEKVDANKLEIAQERAQLQKSLEEKEKKFGIEKTEKQKQESVMSFCARARAYLFLAFLKLFSYRSTPTTITTKITRHDDYILGILLHI
jgi:uncharacterized protein YecA (UPF0149 family)